MTTKTTDQASKTSSDGAASDVLGQSVQKLVEALTNRIVSAGERLATSGDLKGLTEGVVGKTGKAALKSTIGEKLPNIAKSGRSRGKSKGQKITTIIEAVDVGADIGLVYDQWTRFTDFPSYMRKVESVEQVADEKLNWTARILWSSRTWESTILEQVPDQRIVWRSEGAKGHVDGAVTFHDLAPELTRVNLVLEYHPQGGFEHIGNLWRAQGRRARLELKQFQRHVMTEQVLRPDEIEGWRGEIHDGEVVDSPAEDSRTDADQDNGDRKEDRGERKADR